MTLSDLMTTTAEKSEMDTPETGKSCWDAIDAVVCINLNHRQDKWKSFCRTVEGVVPANKLYRERAILGKNLPGAGEPPWFTRRTGDRSYYWTAVAGCVLSHRNAIRRAQQEGWRNVLVFEDDVESRLTDDGTRLLFRTVEKLSGKFMLYLGCKSKRTVGKRVYQCGESALWRVNGVFTTHAYLVPASMYSVLLESLPHDDNEIWEWVARHRAIDAFYREEVPLWRGVKIYAILPQLYKQSGVSSDILMGQSTPFVPDGMTHDLSGWGGIFFEIASFISWPYRKLKVYLNGIRMYHRALSGGFPSFHRPKKKKKGTRHP